MKKSTFIYSKTALRELYSRFCAECFNLRSTTPSERKLTFIYIAVFLCGVIAVEPALAQDYEQMREEILERQEHTRFEIQQLDALILKYSQRLARANRKYNEVFEEFQKLERALALQKDKIAELEKKQGQIEKEIDVTEKKQARQEKRLKELIENYKETLRYLYKNGRSSRLALILAAESLNQMIVRNYYLKEFETYREKQVAEIKETQKELKLSKQQLKAAHEKNEEVLAAITLEKEKLEEKKQRQQSNVRLLRQDREQIKANLQQRKQEKAEFDQTLAALIEREEEIRQARLERIRQREAERQRKLAEAKTIEDEAAREREVERYSTPIMPAGFISEERLNEIEDAFASKKGELPWPVESHTVSKHFGRYRHPVSGTYTRNRGIEIVTEPGAPVKVVHPGQVFAVQPIIGYGNVVFVNHGHYLTAYGNLSRIAVRKSSVLEAGDVVGYSGTAGSERGATVFFMLRGGDENLDPEKWLE